MNRQQDASDIIELSMRLKSTIVLISIVFLSACAPSETADQRKKEANSPAGKVGQVAYGAAKVTGKVAKAAGRELEKAAHDAHEGWKQASDKDKAK